MTRRLDALVALAGAVLVLSGCTSTDDGTEAAASPTPSSSSTPDAPTTRPAPPAPTVGSCYRLGLRQAARPTNGSDPVPCTKQHTARTIHVGRLATVVNGHSLAVDSDRAQRQVRTTCTEQLGRFLGGDAETRALSRFQVVWFSPTLAQSDRGADWFRCDVIAFGDADRLLPLPTEQRLRGVLDQTDALATYGLCGTAQPGADGFERVACGLPHAWVAVSTIPLEGGDRYPGVEAVREAGDDTCSDRVRAANDFVLEFSYGWEWPTREQWEAGQHYGFCWAPNDLA